MAEFEEDLRLETVLRNLNRMLKADPVAISALLKCCVPCNGELAADPTCQVGNDFANADAGRFTVRPLGWLNGALGIRPNHYGYVAAIVRGDGSIEKFVATTGRE